MRARPSALLRVLLRFGLLGGLAVLLAIASGCDGDGGDGGGGVSDAGGGAASDTPSAPPEDATGAPDAASGVDAPGCTPACDPARCQVCEKGACVSTCAADETCAEGVCGEPDGGACEEDGDCDGPCAVCDAASGQCASACVGDERCHAGTPDGDVCEVPPACDCGPCEACDDGDIWAPVCATTCTGDERCRVGADGDGACEVPPSCDCGPCETCDDSDDDSDIWAPVCVSECTGEELCRDDPLRGEICEVPPPCDCDPCEACDQTDVWDPVCVPVCDDFACEVCGEDGETCVSACDAAACEICDGEGGCASACDPATEYCRDGDCLARPDVNCDEADGFCDGSVIDELVLQAGPDDETGDPGCCCDFDDDGVVDNALADLIEMASPFLGYDRPYFNDGIAAQIDAGSLLLLIEFLGLDDLVSDDYVTFNLYLGADANDDPTDNLTGAGEFWVSPASLDADGAPLMGFEAGWVEGGRLHGGPAQFLMPIDLVGQDVPILLVVDGATVEADIAESGVGYALSDGVVCGWLHREKIAAGVNQFTETNCGCLGYTGDFITLQGGTMQCAPVTTSCPSWDYIGSICNQLAETCGALTLVLPALFDLDLTDDGKGDALSLGVTFGATGAALVGVAPTE